MRRLVLLLAIVMTVMTLSPLPALGCSCIEILEPGPILDGAGGAFIGTMVEKHPRVPDEFSATYVFEVSQWVKADLGNTVRVVSGPDSASCGWESPVAGEMGVLLYLEGENLYSGLCSMMDPGVMAELARSHVEGPGAAPPISPEDIGLQPTEGESPSDSTMARVAFGVVGASAVAGAVFATVRRRRSVEEQ